jgi:hypothetical protein
MRKAQATSAKPGEAIWHSWITGIRKNGKVANSIAIYVPEARQWRLIETDNDTLKKAWKRLVSLLPVRERLSVIAIAQLLMIGLTGALLYRWRKSVVMVPRRAW